jgi:cation:H+ antiporter
MSIIWIAVGIGLLYIGGEGLVRGAVALGRRFGVSPIIIGLTIVSFGTSSPELAATLAGVFQGAPAVSFGNVVGSNIANLGLVLGVTALIWPINVAAQFIRREMPILLGVSAAMFLLVRDGGIGRVEAAVLIIALAAYVRSLFKFKEEPAIEAEFEEALGHSEKSALWSFGAVILGILLLVVGANYLIKGAVEMARSIGVSERVIGLTMVAFGTSLPELASCMVAAVRREGDLVLGNLIGSNIFNVLFILGATASIRPFAVDKVAVQPDLIVMMAITILAWLLLRTGTRLARLEGAVLATSYVAYVIYLFL